MKETALTAHRDRRKIERLCIRKKIRKKSSLRYLELFYQMDYQTVL